MVNNSININKTNNHISPSPSPIEQDKDHDKCRWKFQDLGQAQLYGGVKPDNGSPILPSNWISSVNALFYMCKRGLLFRELPL